MSERYPTYSRSNFPDNIDEFDYMNDVTGELYIAVTAYNNYVKNGNFTAAMQLIEANPDLKKCIFNADKHNKLLDAIMSIETFFYEDVEEYIANVVKDRGVWDSTVTDYVKYNVVMDETGMCYLAIQDVLDTKAELSDTNYWKPLAVKGDKGDKGEAFNPRGKYVEGESYAALDVVVYDDKLYVASVDNLGVLPTDTEYWVLVSEVEFPTNDFITDISVNGTELTYTRGDGTAITEEIEYPPQSASNITAGTFAGQVSAPEDTDYTTNRIRNIVFTDQDPGASVETSYINGSIICVYE